MTIGARPMKVLRRYAGITLYETATSASGVQHVKVDGVTFSQAEAHGIPHCDASILHRPGACQYCDRYPVRQRDREVQRINFTGDDAIDKAPCPSEYFRQPSLRDRWHGNVAKPA